MKTCGQCHSPLPGDDDVFCGVCGAPVAGIPLADASRFTRSSEVETSPPYAVGRPLDDALMGEAEANATYLGNRLSYHQVESLDPFADGRYVQAAKRHAVLLVIAALFLTFIFPLPLFALAGIKIYIALGILVWLGAFLVLLFRRIPVGCAEWKFLFDGKGKVANEVFEHIVGAFGRRQTPSDSIVIRRLPGTVGFPGAAQGRDYLQVRSGIYTAYVTSFAFGNDLYIGWTLWWDFAPIKLATIRRGSLRAMIAAGPQVEVQWIHSMEEAKALREAVHAAAREGVDLAAGTVDRAKAGTIGSAVPVEVL